MVRAYWPTPSVRALIWSCDYLCCPLRGRITMNRLCIPNLCARKAYRSLSLLNRLEKKSVFVHYNSSGGRGLPLATTTSVLMRRIILHHGASTRMNYSACHSMRSSRWRQWWERVVSLISTRTAKVRGNKQTLCTWWFLMELSYFLITHFKPFR